MTVNILRNEFVKLNSYGVELNYYGTSIEYCDDTNTFLLFYYKKFCRAYVINGKNEEQNLVQVKERIQIIVKYDNRSCKRFFKFLRSKIDDEFIYTIDPLFFCEIKTFLEKRNYMDYLNYIYAKYKKRIY